MFWYFLRLIGFPPFDFFPYIFLICNTPTYRYIIQGTAHLTVWAVKVLVGIAAILSRTYTHFQNNVTEMKDGNANENENVNENENLREIK